MLQNIGDSIKGTGEGGSRSRWVWYLIIGVLALVFFAWGPTTVVDFSFGQDTYAAKVNGEEISAERLNDQWSRQLPQLMEAFGGDLTEEQRASLKQELIDTAVRERVTLQYAHKIGFRVSEAEKGRAFRNEEAFQIDGQFSLMEARTRLANAGVTEREYIEDVGNRLMVNKMLGVIGATDFLTPAEARRILALLDEEREIRFVLLEPEGWAGKDPISADAIEAYYKAHLDDFAIPESVKLAYAEMLLSDVAATVVVTEEQLKARYEQDKASYVQPETRSARHILLSVGDPAEDARQAELAKDLYTQIQGGADFAELARKHSQDSASAANGGDLGWAARETYVPPFAEKLFSMKTGEVSEPVKTEFGYHIIKLEGIRPEVGRTFEQVRAELEVQMRNDAAVARFNSEQDRLQEELENSSASFDALVKDFNMRRGTVENFERGAGGMPLGSDTALNREVFSDELLQLRRIGGPAQLAEDRVTIFRVEEHRPASTRPLEEVRAEIVTALTRERGTAAALAAAQKGVEDLAAGRSFEQVVSGLKAKAEPARFVARGAPDLPVELRDALFAAPRPTPEKPVRQALALEDGSVALFQSTATRTGAMLDVPQLVQLRSDRELQRYSRRDVNAYIDSLVEDAKVVRNPDALLQ